MHRSPDARLADLADVLLSVARSIHAPLVGDIEQLTATETTVMRYIDRNPGTTASAAAAGTRLQRSNLSTAVRRFEQRGLVERSHDDHDARSVHLHPTALAAANLLRLRAAWAAVIGDALGEGADVEAAIALLERLESGLGPTAGG